MKKLAEFALKSLADNPDAVVVDCVEEGAVVKIKVKLDEGDKGKIIGREGKVIKAVRTLVGAVAYKQGKKLFLDIE